MSPSQTTSLQGLAAQWKDKASIARDAHYKQAKIVRRRHVYLGIPVVIVSTVVGTSVFASLAHTQETNVKLVIGVLSVASSILAALQTFHNYAQQAEHHRMTAIRFSAIVRRLEFLAAANNGDEQLARILEDVAKEWNEINIDAPLAPMSVWLPTVAQLTRNKEA